MTRAAWLGLLLLAACSRSVAPPPAPVPVASGPAVCRIGPDGGRPVPDRGRPVADRGIGGTGAPTVQTADRGIGGTGIIGVITGFASVCVAGEEVGLPPNLPAQIDGRPGTLDDLRAGQVVAVQAAGPASALQAQEIVVRHVVVGPVQSGGNGLLTVAGQPVLVGDAVGNGVAATPGQFVAVSGLRQPGGSIVATRIDLAPPGPVLLRGELTRIYGTARIGSQIVQLPDGSGIPGGFPVVVTGTMRGDVLVADSIARDIADESPAAYFGPTVSTFVVEGYLAVAAGGYFVNRDFIRGDGFATGRNGRSIANFSRRPDGGLAALGQRLGGGAAPGRSFGVAPTPRGGGFGPAQQPGGGLDPGSRLGGPPARFQPPDFSGQGGFAPQGPSPRR